MAADADFLMQSLREVDPDRHLSILYAPSDKRDALAALYLFNGDIAAIRDRVREPLPGEMRIQWWRDALAASESAAAGHPVAEALRRAISCYRLPLDAFEHYLDARVFDLYDDPMPSRSDLEGYCGETASAIIQLAALILDPKAAASFSEAAGHAGCAQAIAGLLLLLPLHRSRGQCYVPNDVLAAAGTDRDGFLAGIDTTAIERVLSAMVALGREHVTKFEQAAQGMPAGLRPAFLPASLATVNLNLVSRRGADALQRTDNLSPLRKHWIMLRRALRGWG